MLGGSSIVYFGRSVLGKYINRGMIFRGFVLVID